MNSRLLLLLALFTASAHAAVYQYVDEEGNVVFTDKPVEGGFERKLKEPTVIQFKKEPPAKKTTAKKESKVEEEKAVAQQYSRIEIVSPVHEGTVKQDAGIVEITLRIEPQLQTEFKHNVKLSFDGRWSKDSYTSTSITLENIDRGEHRIKVAIVDEAGKRLKSSKEVVFYLRRFSKHFR